MTTVGADRWMEPEIMVTREGPPSRNQAGPGRGLGPGNEQSRNGEFQGRTRDIKKYSRPSS